MEVFSEARVDISHAHLFCSFGRDVIIKGVYRLHFATTHKVYEVFRVLGLISR